jgi:competence protein ComEC
MFSFFAFATLINRQTNSINTLFLSYFTLLLINPMWLFYVGFQLSYLAVFFILWILPSFNRLYYPKNRIIKKLWGIVTVTIAAQLGIIPLSIYYFHQFPGLFFITNIVVLPFLGMLLGGGILIIVLAVFNVLPDWLVLIYNSLIKMLNTFISWVAHQDSFIFQDIHFSIEKVGVSYLLIITFILLWKKRSVQRIGFSLMSFALLICVFIWDDYINSDNQLIIFHKTRHSLIGYQYTNELRLFRSDSTFNYQNKYPIKGFRVAKNISDYSDKKLPQVFRYKQNTILVLDSLGVYPKHSEIDIVLLSLSPKVNLERMIDSLHPKQIIADGNNYRSYVNRWRKTCKEKNVLFHFTGSEGAYVIK